MKTHKVVIVGGGSAGWMTAATLIKAFPEKDISVIESKNIPTVGVGESTIGGIRTWAKYIGLNESDFFPQTDASFKLSIKFTDFYKKNSGSFHYPFGKPLQISEENPFFEWHLKKYFYPDTETEDFVRCLFPAAALFENNKFSLNRNGEFDNFNPDNDIAYHFDATKFGAWLKNNYCLPRGVKHIESTVVKINCDENGISNLILESDEIISADLFIDCTGFKSILLAGALEEEFDSFSDMLPNNKAWATRIEYKDKEKELEGFTNCTALGNGWVWNIPLWSRLGTGYVYSDKFISPEEAKEEFKNYLTSDKMVVPRTREEVDALEFKDISMRVGIHKRTFVKNVVAIGLSAGFIEPLESNGLFSVHEFLFKLIDILQRGEINEFDRYMYNTSTRELFDTFSRFVALHYSLSHRTDTEYWRAISKKDFAGALPYPVNETTDAFYNMHWRYMSEWGHPSGPAGITYIATGLNINMLNDARIMNLSSRYGVNLKDITDRAANTWEAKKNKWKVSAEKSESLNSFLRNNFYGGDFEFGE
jgi:tryptophan halogenase